VPAAVSCACWLLTAACAGHIKSLRSNPFLADAKIVFIAERNTGFEAGRTWDVVREFHDTYPLYQTKAPSAKRRDTPQENPGIFTGAQLPRRVEM